MIFKYHKKIMTKIDLNFKIDICKGCGLCVEVCPLKILKLNENVVNSKGYHPVYEDQKNTCIGCKSCALMCPDSVITIKKL